MMKILTRPTTKRGHMKVDYNQCGKPRTELEQEDLLQGSRHDDDDCDDDGDNNDHDDDHDDACDDDDDDTPNLEEENL